MLLGPDYIWDATTAVLNVIKPMPVLMFLTIQFSFRHYLLDLMRVTPRDANYTGPGSRFCILRPELITAFCQVSYDVLIVQYLFRSFRILIDFFG